MILMPLTSRQGISGVALMTPSGNLVAMSPSGRGIVKHPYKPSYVGRVGLEPTTGGL